MGASSQRPTRRASIRHRSRAVGSASSGANGPIASVRPSSWSGTVGGQHYPVASTTPRARVVEQYEPLTARDTRNV